MPALANTFEGGTSTVAVSAANSGGTSGNAFDVVTIGGGATLAFDSTRTVHGGGMACQVATVASAASFATWSTSMGSQSQMWFRAYLYFTAFPANTHKIVTFRQGATLCGYVQLNTTGKLGFLDAVNSSIFAEPAAIPLGQWIRIEGFLTGSATVGQAELKLFTSAESATPFRSDTSAASQNTFGAPDNCRFGVETAVASAGPFWMDDIGLSSAGYPGPAAGAGPFYPLNRPVRARPVNLRPGTVRHAAGIYGQTGPAVRRLPGPVTARVRLPLPSGGRTVHAAGTYAQTGPPVKARPGPVRSRIPPPPPGGQRGRGRAGVFGGTGPALKALAAAVATLFRGYPARGRTAGRAGTFTAPRLPPRPLAGPVRGQPQKPVITGRARGRSGTFTFVAPPAPVPGALSASTAPAASLSAEITASLDSIYPLTYGAAYAGGGTPVPRLTTSTDPAAMLAAATSAAGIPDNPVYAAFYATYYGITPGGLLSATDAKAGGPG